MLDWLQRHGVDTGPKLYMDSLRLSVDALERLKSRGGGPDPLAERFPVGRPVIGDVEWQNPSSN